MRTPCVGFLSFIFVLGTSWAANPIVPNVGMADPNVRLMNGTFFAWATHDYSVNNTGFKMLDWWVWSSADLVSWTLESTVVPADIFPWDEQQNECWATDAALRNGRYFFYVSVGGSSIAVAAADSPRGPWSDPLRKPLLDSGVAKSLRPTTTFRDPCVFQDDDGTFYLIAGVFEYYIAAFLDLAHDCDPYGVGALLVALFG